MTDDEWDDEAGRILAGAQKHVEQHGRPPFQFHRIGPAVDAAFADAVASGTGAYRVNPDGSAEHVDLFGSAGDDDPEEVDELPAPPRKSIPEADLQLLELAARALGAVRTEEVDGEGYLNLHFEDGSTIYAWNSLVHSDDTFNLAADLELDIMHRVVGGRRVEALAAGGPLVQEFYEGDRKNATRRAVTRAAAEITKQRSTQKFIDSRESQQ